MTNLQRPTWAEASEDMAAYYDDVWGRPVTDERGAYARLVLESFQSGLSWRTVWAREAVFREAFADFDPEEVATYDDSRVAALLEDPRMIRNRRKIEAAVVNARATLALRDEVPPPERGRIEAGLPSLIWAYAVPTPDRPLAPAEPPSSTAESTALAKDLKQRGFKHLGPVSVYAAMQAMGIVNDHPRGSARWRELEAERARILGW